MSTLDLNVKYAIVGLAPYSLHYDLSQCTFPTFRLSKYFFALNDLHHFGIEAQTLRKIIRSEFISAIEQNGRSIEFVLKSSAPDRTMDLGEAIDASNLINQWSKKSYPKTASENKQILREYLHMLKANSIHPVLVLPPMMKEYQEGFCREKIVELFGFLNDLRRCYSFTFVNFWAMHHMFNDYDFFDIMHLNIHGSRKFSAKLNRVIMDLERNL